MPIMIVGCYCPYGGVERGVPLLVVPGCASRAGGLFCLLGRHESLVPVGLGGADPLIGLGTGLPDRRIPLPIRDELSCCQKDRSPAVARSWA